MIFGEFPSDQAEGLALAHTLKLPGRTLRKGRVLTADDVAALGAAGIGRVAGARLAAGELLENAAAAEIASLIAGEYLVARPAFTGRCNLYASAPGLLQVDRDCVDRLNAIGEAVTLGTLPPFTPVLKDQRVATVKIIPFAVSAGVIDAWRQTAARPPLSLAPWRAHRAALILSESASTTPKVLAATVVATRGRLEPLGSRLDLELRCPHDSAAIASCLTESLAAGCDLVLISGATISKDRGDVVPAAIESAGGEIVHFGMPVEPGNMLLLARVGQVPVVNLPGCARSRRTNGLDWVLQRLLAGLPVDGAALMAMGVGGLLHSAEDLDKEDGETPQAPVAGQAPRIAALILAAGASSRMGGQNKLLRIVDGLPLVRHAVDAALASRCPQVLVVTGCESESVESTLDPDRVSIVRNPDYSSGMSTSLRCGLAALPTDTAAVLVLLADMPRVSAAHIDRIVGAFDPARPAIVAPTFQGRRGNPVLWPRRFFAELRGIVGDTGARGLLGTHAAEVQMVPIDSEAILADVDTPADLAALSRP